MYLLPHSSGSLPTRIELAKIFDELKDEFEKKVESFSDDLKYVFMGNISMKNEDLTILRKAEYEVYPNQPTRKENRQILLLKQPYKQKADLTVLESYNSIIAFKDLAYPSEKEPYIPKTRFDDTRYIKALEEYEILKEKRERGEKGGVSEEKYKELIEQPWVQYLLGKKKYENKNIASLEEAMEHFTNSITGLRRKYPLLEGKTKSGLSPDQLNTLENISLVNGKLQEVKNELTELELEDIEKTGERNTLFKRPVD